MRPKRLADRRSRRGTTYLAVCGMVLLVATIALGGLAATRLRTRAARNANDLVEARQYALSATEIGRLWIAQDKNWRTTYPSGAWFANKPIGRGQYSLSVQNVNGGALNRSSYDPVAFSAAGQCGKAAQYVQVTLGAQTTPHSCLTAALSAASGINLTNSVIVDANNQTLATNGGVTVVGSATINANVSASGLIVGGAFNGTNTVLAKALTFPDATAFDYYQQNGTAIPIATISGSNVQDVLISPTSNPYGGVTNANGIYIIDCQGQNLTIQSCRIVGTLVLLNPGSGTAVKNSVVWSPAVNNYPCLMANGNLTINASGASLNETALQNYNPPGTAYPYPNGVSNTTNADSFPAAIQGLIYASGNLTLQGSELAANVIVAGGAFQTSGSPSLYLSYDQTYYTNPPPGFGQIQMIPLPGSWQQVVH